MRETFSVPEVSCEHCKSSIEGALAPLPGVSQANVVIEEKQVDVTWNSDSNSRDDIVGAIEGAGYKVGA